MTNFTQNITTYNKKKFTEINIPSDSKIQYVKDTIIRLYEKTFNAGPGNHYIIAPNCIIKSKNKELYTVKVKEIKNNNNKVISSIITIDYKVPRDNVLPKHTGDKAIIDFKVRGSSVKNINITNFDVDTTYATSTGEKRAVTVTGDFNAMFEIIIKNEAGNVTNRLTNLRIPKPFTGSSQGIYTTSITIPESTSSTTYTVEIIEGENSKLSNNINTTKTINQYGPAGINVSFSNTTAISLVTSGTTPVAVNGIEVGEPGANGVIDWTITKSGPTKIYAHRHPAQSNTIAYNTSGSNDWTNTLVSDNGGTNMKIAGRAVQRSNTSIDIDLVATINRAGTTNVSPVLNLDNFISVAPPAFGTTVTCDVASSVSIDLGSENNTVPVSSTYMSGGWSTVSAPGTGSLGSYGAYDGGVGVAGVVTYTAPSVATWLAAESPESVSFSYKVNDSTTDSATHEVVILLNYLG